MTDLYAEARERFERDTTHHTMTVLHDDGLYRHLRFKAPGTGFYWFDLITWPGRLAFTGDGDGFIFARVDDMFTFFRGRGINPDYWAEKVIAGRDGLKTYSEVRARKLIEEAAQEANWTGLLDDVRKEVLTQDDMCDEAAARLLLRDYEFVRPDDQRVIDAAELAWSRALTSGAPRSEIDAARTAYAREKHARTFTFDSSWEWDLCEWDWWFLWACHAIVWGIAQYDAGRVTTSEAARA